MPKRYFEDFAVGDKLPLGSKLVTRDEIIAFATEFDPRPAHLDAARGGEALVEGPIASSWHVGAMFMDLLCGGFLLDSSSLGSPGMETLKWEHPVRPDDRIEAFSTVIEARASKSRPEMGIVRFRHEVLNQTGKIVMWIENPILFGRRQAAIS